MALTEMRGSVTFLYQLRNGITSVTSFSGRVLSGQHSFLSLTSAKPSSTADLPTFKLYKESV